MSAQRAVRDAYCRIPALTGRGYSPWREPGDSGVSR